MITKFDNPFLDPVMESPEGIFSKSAPSRASLPQLLKAEKAFERVPQQVGHHGLFGQGPSHIDTFDLRTTRHPRFGASSIRFRRLLPRCVFECLPATKQMDQCSIVRSIADTHNNHSSFHVTPQEDATSVDDAPVRLFRIQGSELGTPPYVDREAGSGSFSQHCPFRIQDEWEGPVRHGQAGRFDKRYASREGLLKSFDSLRDCDQSGSIAGLEPANGKLLKSSIPAWPKLLISRTRNPKSSALWQEGQNYLLARRVVKRAPVL